MPSPLFSPKHGLDSGLEARLQVTVKTQPYIFPSVVERDKEKHEMEF